MNSLPSSAFNNKAMVKNKEEDEATRLEHQSLNARKRKQTVASTVAAGEFEEHAIHIWSERERRKRMRDMFSNLHALLPQLPPKTDKTTIVDEAAKYIKILQHTLQTLQKLKLERLQDATIVHYGPSMVTTHMQPSREEFLAEHYQSIKALSLPTSPYMSPPLTSPFYPPSFETWTSPNVVVNLRGFDAQISVCSVKRPGILSTIFQILKKHNLEVVTAHASSDHFHSMYMIYAHADGAFDQLPEALPVEEKFKLAVGEINLWLSSSYGY